LCNETKMYVQLVYFHIFHFLSFHFRKEHKSNRSLNYKICFVALLPVKFTSPRGDPQGPQAAPSIPCSIS
jgi:hypothetical protein